MKLPGDVPDPVAAGTTAIIESHQDELVAWNLPGSRGGFSPGKNMGASSYHAKMTQSLVDHEPVLADPERQGLAVEGGLENEPLAPEAVNAGPREACIHRPSADVNEFAFRVSDRRVHLIDQQSGDLPRLWRIEIDHAGADRAFVGDVKIKTFVQIKYPLRPELPRQFPESLPRDRARNVRSAGSGEVPVQVVGGLVHAWHKASIGLQPGSVRSRNNHNPSPHDIPVNDLLRRPRSSGLVAMHPAGDEHHRTIHAGIDHVIGVLPPGSLGQRAP